MPEAHDARGADQRLTRLSALFVEHMPFVYRTARRMGVPDSSLDDVVQDVFLVVHRRWDELTWTSSVPTLLFGVTLRVVKDHRRALARRRTRIVDAPVLPDTARAEGGTPDETLERHQARQILGELLAALDDDKRAILIAVELEQLSVPEVARAMQLKLNTTYTKLRAARQEFSKAVARYQARVEATTR